MQKDFFAYFGKFHILKKRDSLIYPERNSYMNNTNYSASSALDGTKTLENLKQAFQKEAEAFAKNKIYAELADKSGEYSVYKALSDMSENDRRHAELWLGYLDELGDTYENLSALSELAEVLKDNIYKPMADIADDEGFSEIAEKMRLVSNVKNTHTVLLDEQLSYLSDKDGRYVDNPETEWHCRSCGYIVKGNMPPERCPLCSYPENYFSKG